MSGYGLGPMAPSRDRSAPPAPVFEEPLPYLVQGCFSMDLFEFPPPKRQRLITDMAGSLSQPSASSIRRKSSTQSFTTGTETPTTNLLEKAIPNSTPVKSRRVRTGCLTCRERHLKCDEAVPDCLNCRKSSRECKRGVRLNFIDVQVKDPPYVPPALDWSVQFQDESRQIASEYQGGLGRYARLGAETGTPSRDLDVESARKSQSHHQKGASQKQRMPRLDSVETTRLVDTSCTGMQAPVNASMYGPSDAACGQGLASETSALDGDNVSFQKSNEMSLLGTGPPPNSGNYKVQDRFIVVKEESPSQATHHTHQTSDASSSTSVAATATNPSASSFRTGRTCLSPDDLVTLSPAENLGAGDREYLTTPEEVLYMQVFVEEVGVWMDSLDKDKHFSRLIPYHALKSPMLLNAFLACGVKHLTLVNPAYKDDKALFYYDTATTQLLRSLQNPDRNTAECATTAVVLNVYEIMSEKPQQRMNHIAGARALIRECGWDARSTGVGAACFWLNIGMEVLSCLAFNWKTAWDPDQWGVDMDFSKGRKGCGGGGDEEEGDCSGRAGGEEIWVHRIFYIVARIANFRATIPRFQEASPRDEQARLVQRLEEWQELKRLCDSWNSSCPRTMHPFGYLHSSQTNSKSAFPNVWLIKRAAIIGRLFYHTAQCLLAQTNPLEPSPPSDETRRLQLHHAHQVCGIVAHSKDRGVASVAIRSLAIASSVLVERTEQEEVLEMLNKINAETGWRLGKVLSELKQAWGWEGGRSGSLVGQVFSGVNMPGARASPPQPHPHPQGPPSLQSSPHQTPQTQNHRRHQSHQHHQLPHHTQPRQQQHQQQRQQRQHTPTNPTPSHSQTQRHTIRRRGNSTPAPIVACASSTVVAPAPVKAPVNPLSFADFSLPNHPYQNWYEPPNRSGSFSQTFF